MKKSYLTVTDQFCGAGGSSIGATAAGAELRLALNHWDLAIQTHNSNFPNALHDCTDISACDPRRYPSTDILITSPECTNHSLAKGKRRHSQPDLFGANVPDPAEERSRATMWDVPRFAEYHRYNAIIVENVVDARHWVTWDAWLHAMQLLGYEHQIVFLNSMFAWPTPQSRDRMYVIFWRKGNTAPELDFHPPAHCEKCQREIAAVQSWKRPGQRWGRYGAQYVYRCPTCASEVKPYYNPAASAIDWSLPAPRIGDRDKPLKDKTMARIRVGLEKYAADFHFMIDLRGENAPKAMTDPLSTVVASGNHHALVVQISHDGNRARPVTQPMPTQTARQDMALLMPYYSTGVAKPTSEPVPTVTTTDRHALVVPPFLLGYYTRVAGVQAAISLVQPGSVPAVEDCGFRMLRPHEIRNAMAFPENYIVLGNGREQVKQYGNAVTPPVMQMLVERVVAAL